MKRALAVVAAVGMVLVALFVRGTFSDGGGASGGGGGGGSTPDDLTVACPPELAEACRSAFGDGAVIASAGTTLDQIAQGTIEVDAWLVSRPWAEAAQADFPGEVDSVTTTGAQSPIVIAIWSDRRQFLAGDGCERPFGLGCLGDVAGRSFSDLGASFPEDVAVGLTDLSTMSGFDVVSGGASSFFGRDDYASNDFDSSFQTWLRAFQSDAVTSTGQLETMFTIGTGRFTAIVGVEAVLRPLEENAARSSEIDLLATPTSSELFIVDFAGGPDASGAADDGDLLDALAEAGWRVPGKDAPPALATTDDEVTLTEPSTDGMAVKEGVLAALRSLAEQTS